MLPTVFLPVMEGFQENTDLTCTTVEKEGWTECFRGMAEHSGFWRPGRHSWACIVFYSDLGSTSPKHNGWQSSITAVLRGGKLSLGLEHFL